MMAGMFFERHRERREHFRPALRTAGPGRRGALMTHRPSSGHLHEHNIRVGNIGAFIVCV